MANHQERVAKQLEAAILAMLDPQMDKLVRRLQELHAEWGPLKPNGMQLIYTDDKMEFAWGADLSLPLKVAGADQLLTGSELLTTLCGSARLGLSDAPFSHFTYIEGGEVSLNGIAMPKPMRRVIAWDLHHVVSYLSASREPLPYPHRVAKTFQQLHVNHTIETLGLHRGPKGRRERLAGQLREVEKAAKVFPDDDAAYLDDVSDTSALETWSKRFWKGISPAVPPWRLLAVEGQPVEVTRHEGRDTLPGHLAERIVSQLHKHYVMKIQKRSGDEPILSAEPDETEADPSSLGKDPAEHAIDSEFAEAVRALPGYQTWYRVHGDGHTQQQVAEDMAVTQARVSQIIAKFMKAANEIALQYGIEIS